MKCTYRKLKESVSDTSLPILPILELKSYFYQTVLGQTIDVSSVLPAGLKFNKLRVEAVVKYTALDFNALDCRAFGTRGAIGLLGSVRDKAHSHIGENTLKVSVNLNEDVTLYFDGSTNTTAIGTDTQTGVGTVSTSEVQKSFLLGSLSMDSTILVKEVKMYDTTADTLLGNFVAAKLNNDNVVYDKLNDVILYPNTGVLGIVD